MRSGEWLTSAARRLRDRGVESPDLSARLILAEVSGASPARLLAFPEDPLSPEAVRIADALLERRERHEPMAYLLGRKEFRNLTLRVTPAVLIPRPETEELIDLAKSLSPNAKTLLDAGAGSGCIALSLAEVFPSARVYGTDRSSEALAVARSNDPDRRVRWMQMDWLTALGADQFDLIASNPPYLTEEEMQTLEPQVRDYEPIGALSGGRGGCEEYRRLIPQIAECLAPGGWTVLEIGPSVAEGVGRLLAESGFIDIAVHPDLAGRKRFAVGAAP